MEIRSKASPAFILISLICMMRTHHARESVQISIYVQFQLLDELLELKEGVKHESEAGEVLDLISIQIS